MPRARVPQNSEHSGRILRIAKLTRCDVKSRMGALVSAPIWPRVAACPAGEFRERVAELAFQAIDVGTVADALEAFEHQRYFFAVPSVSLTPGASAKASVGPWRLKDEVRDASLLVRRSPGCVDVGFDAGLAPSSPDVPCASSRSTPAFCAFCTPKTPTIRPTHAAASSRSIEIALDDFDALARQRRCPLAIRSSRQATQMEPGALQSLRNRAALIAREPFDRLSWPVS